MGFLPARMTRLLLGGHQSLLQPTIEALHAEGVLHIEDYQDASGHTSIGTPLPSGEELSATLVRLRGLKKALGADEAALPAPAVGSPSADTLAAAEAAASPVIDQAARVRAELATVEAAQQALASLRGLELDTAMLGSLRSVKVAMGTARNDPTSAFATARLAGEIQAIPSATGFAVAAVVPQRDAAAADRILADAGFQAASIPAGKGTPGERLQQLASQKTALETELAQAEARIAELRTQWAGPLVALEAHLVSEVEKTQAPLQFGVTATTFHVEGWVPADRAAAVTQSLQRRFGDRLYVQDMGDAPRSGDGHGHDGHGIHGHDHPQGHSNDGHSHDGHSHDGHSHDGHSHDGHSHDGHSHDGHEHPHGHDPHANVAGHDKHDVAAHEGDAHHSDPKDEAPVLLRNPRAAKPYEWILGLLNRPLYNEVDPSKLMLLFFPLFFGLMVGDVVTGILIALFGAWLRNNRFIGIGGPAVGKAIMAGGLVAILMGGVLYGEAMGIHFVVNPEQTHEGDASWETILGLHIPFANEAHGLVYKTGTASTPLLEDRALTDLHPENPTHLVVAGLQLGHYSKLHDVQPLGLIALAIAGIHMGIGLLIGFRNVRQAHGTTLAIQEKLAMLTLVIGLAYFAFPTKWAVVPTTPAGIVLGMLFWSSLVLLYMGAAKVYGMGFIGPMEVVSFLGNFVSYTRLAAIGAAEAGLGLAVYSICFHLLPGGAVGWIVYIVMFCGLVLLSVLSGGLQSLRLQFVEFFGKFFGGGGRTYVPFGRRAA